MNSSGEIEALNRSCILPEKVLSASWRCQIVVETWILRYFDIPGSWGCRSTGVQWEGQIIAKLRSINIHYNTRVLKLHSIYSNDWLTMFSCVDTADNRRSRTSRWSHWKLIIDASRLDGGISILGCCRSCVAGRNWTTDDEDVKVQTKLTNIGRTSANSQRTGAAGANAGGVEVSAIFRSGFSARFGNCVLNREPFHLDHDWKCYLQ